MPSQSAGVSRTKSIIPLPPDIANLPAIKAKPWFQVSPDPNLFLEGPAFDRQGNLFFTAPFAGIVFKVTPSKQLSTIFSDANVRPCGSAFHKDGRLFIGCVSGGLLVMNPDGTNVTHLYPQYQGKNLEINDMVFDSMGNIYVTHFTGSVVEPTGGVFRTSSDAKTVQPIVQHLVLPNGISLAPQGNILWVGETTINRIIRIALQEDGLTLMPIDGVNCAYYSTGCPGGPDSNKVDVAGNLYQTIAFQGRVLVLNPRGIPIANVLMPERDEGKLLATTNVAFKPGTSEGYMTTSGEGGAWIFTFQGLAEGLNLFSHQ